MASAGGHDYDEHLLSSAPKPDRRALQEGYDPTLLSHQEPKPERARSSTPRQASSPTPGPGSPTDRDVERGVVVPPAVVPKPGAPAPGKKATPIAPPTKSRPFYKTKKGLFIIAGVLIAIIIAAVVGGVVGGRNRSSSSSNGSAGAQSGEPLPSSTSAGSPGGTQATNPDDSQGQGSESSSTIENPAGFPSGLPGVTNTAENGQTTSPPGLPPLRRRRLH